MNRKIPFARTCTALTLFLLSSSTLLQAQNTTTDKKPDTPPAHASAPERPTPPDWTLHTYTLHNVTQQNDANEVVVALRNMLQPSVRVILVTSENTIMVYAGPDQQQVAAGIIRDLDKPRQSYKLTYTFTEYDAGKRAGIQHHSLTLVTGQRATFKEGSKIPILTGSLATPNAPNTFQQQFQYIDVGLNLDASIDPYANGIRLRTKVEQSSSVEDKPISGVSEPVIRQSVFEGTAILSPGKPTTLGSIEVPGTTRRVDIEVVSDLMP